jgi:D-alanyl-D-alanine carboxypeptidase
MSMATFQKFLFLGVMLAIAFISGGKAGLGEKSAVKNYSPPPLPAGADASGVPLLSASGVLEPDSARSGAAGEAEEARLYPAAVSEKRVFHPISADSPPEVQAQIALVADLQTGEAYFELNPGKRWPTASIAKLMTAAYAMRNMDLNSEITLAAQDFPLDAGDASRGFRPGDVYRLKDLLSALLLVSSNEAGEAIANAYGREKFVSGITALAGEWGMVSAYFADPTGLSAADQASARDLRVMAQKIYEAYPGVFATTRKKNAVVTEVKTGRRETLVNINLLAGQAWFLGGKTGYTDEAGGNLLTIISHGGRPVAVVVLGSPDRFGETEKLVNWFRQNYRLNS